MWSQSNSSSVKSGRSLSPASKSSVTYGGSVFVARTNVTGYLIARQPGLVSASSLQYDSIAGMLIRQPTAPAGLVDQMLVELAVQFIRFDHPPTSRSPFPTRASARSA